MRLQQFIETNAERILAEWVSFARTRTGAEGMNVAALRDHAAGMLAQIAIDLGTPQTSQEQFEKSRGPDDVDAAHLDPSADASDDSAAETHGADRASSGFTVADMVAEFRALRASILRLWIAERGVLDSADLHDMMRFNEAVDQAVAESIARFTRDVDRARDMFIAILSHDLRTPLQTVLLSTQQLLDAPMMVDGQAVVLGRVVRSTLRMNEMIDDLLDFTRSRMGAGIAVEVVPLDLRPLVREAVEEVVVAYPDHHFVLEPGVSLPGRGDAGRLRQVLSNLLGNAADHGLVEAPIRIAAWAGVGETVIEVRNMGRLIAPRDMGSIFGPFKRLRAGQAKPEVDPAHLGLGLYIADQIVTAHGGRIEVSSTAADGTCFAVHLPA